MEKTIEKSLDIINENEKVIANILHDIKSPLYSIKIGLQGNLENELNKEIFSTTLSVIEYIENFLVNYSFKRGKFDNKIASCDVKKIIDKKIENYKYIFIDKNIHIDMVLDDCDFSVYSIEIFLSSIIGNIVSNIAFHANRGDEAVIQIYKKNQYICADFKNNYNSREENFSLGLDFCAKLASSIKAELKFTKTKDSVCVNLKVPSLKNLKRQIINI